MSLFDPSANLFAIPPLPDLPINQPALGDNIAWSFDDGADYDYWSNLDGGFDDSWTWDERKEASWRQRKGQANSVLITVKPSEDVHSKARSAQDRGAPKTASDEDHHDDEPEPALATDVNDQSASIPGAEWNFLDWANDLPDPMDVTAATQDFAPSQMWDDVGMSNAFPVSNDMYLHNDLFLSDGMASGQNWQPTALCDSGILTAADPQAFIRPSDTDLLELPQSLQGVVVEQSSQEYGDEGVSRWTGLEKDLMQALSAEYPGQSQLELPESSAQGISPPSLKAFRQLSSVDQEMLDRDSSSPTATVLDGATPSADYDGNRLVSCSTCQKIVKRRKLHDHMRWHIRSFGCESCDKSFASEKDLKRHERQHTGAKPFKCEVLGCKYARTGFARLDNLKRHVKKLHGDGVS